MWNLPPRVLCRQHLLDEHRSLHALAGSIYRDQHGFSRWPVHISALAKHDLIEVWAIPHRHASVRIEMQRRGYKHDHEKDYVFLFKRWPEGRVDRYSAWLTLYRRCAECRTRMKQYVLSEHKQVGVPAWASWVPEVGGKPRLHLVQ